MKKFLKSPWALALVPVVFSTILTAIYDVIKENPILSTLWGWIKVIWNWMLAFFNIELKIWWVLFGIASIIIVLFLVAKFARKNETTLPEFASYKEDTFGGWKWSWEWQFKRYDGKWHIDNLRAHCPKCNTPMFHDDGDTVFQCPRCDFETDYRSKHKRRNEVEAIIIDNLDRQRKQHADVDCRV